MKLTLRKTLAIFLIVLGLIVSKTGQASHFYGADLNYTWVSGYTYRVTLTVFGDCGGAAFSALNGSTAELRIYNGATLFKKDTLFQQGSGFEVTPVCPAQANNTNCKSVTNTIPGVKRYIYAKDIVLNDTSSNWKFQFYGNMSGSAAGRSNSITNINTGTTTVLEAKLNNSLAPNTSVGYTTIPTPFFCINKPANYNPGAVDPDLDSLSFSLVPGLSPGGTVTYVTGYSATAPLATALGSYSFSPSNGQISFTPNAVQRSLVVGEVREYRNGILVGTSMREMTFVALSSCSNNPPTGVISNTSSGVYNLGASGVEACAAQGLISFKINPTDSDGNHINIQVAGLPSGASFNITGNNGYTPSGTFVWNITNVAPGTYNFFLTFTDDGCSLSSKQSLAYSVTVYGKPNPGIALISAATCVKKAKISFSPTKGSPPYTISITGGTVNDTFKNVTGTVIDSLPAGSYTVSTQSSIGCSYDTTLVIVAPNTLNVSALATSPTCANGSDGTLTVTASNGLAPYTYSVDSGAFSSSNVLTGLASGTHIIHVKDSGGCTKDSAFIILPTPDIYASVNLSKPPCNHFANGSISLSAYNSVPTYTYAIDTSSFSSSGTFNGLYSGPYTIHIKNGLGCIKDTLVILPDSVKITASVPVTNTLCYGDSSGTISILATGAYPPYSYALNGGTFGSSSVFSGLVAGTYTVHVRDTAQCYFDTTIILAQPTVVTASAFASTNVTCNGGADGVITVNAGGGTPPYTYNINLSPYFPTNVFTSLPAGTYTLRVKDSNGCLHATSATVIEPSPILIGHSFVSPLCSYSSDGALTLSATGGTPGYTFAVDAGTFSTVNSFGSLPGGVHVLHVKDTLGCPKDSTISLLAPARIKPQVAVRNSTCNTLGDGTVLLSATGGTPGYTYALNAGSFSSNGYFTGLAAGTYTFHVKDTAGCIGDTTITIIDSLVLHASVVTTNVLCFEAANGSITVTGIGGQIPYQYALVTGSFGPSGYFSPLADSTYTIHLKDTNGCLLDTTVVITQPNLLVPGAQVTNASCHGASDGSVMLSARGGTAPYSYAKGSGSFTSTPLFDFLSAGTDTFFVKDSNGCVSDTVITISEPSQLMVSVAITDAVCNGGNTGTATITANGGTPSYSYSIDGGAYGGSNMFTLLPAGTHTLSVKDAHGCVKDTSVIIGEPTKLLLNYSLARPLCNGEYSGSITMNGSGGTSPYLYSLNASSYTSTTFYNGLNAGSYFLHLKDAHGCKVDSLISLTEPSALAFAISLTPVACNGDSSGTATIIASGGTTPYRYAIDGGAFTSVNSFTNLPAGTYTLHLKDTNNCTKDTQIVISQPTKLRLSFTLTDPLCNGDSNATLSITGIGGTIPYQYAINAGIFGSTSNFSGLPAGSYALHVVDTNGCRRDSTIIITEPSPVTITASATNVLCHGGNSGTVTITANGGIAPYTYASDAGAYGTSNILTGLNAGTHILHTKDGNGCIKDTSITLTEPTPLLLSYSLTLPRCAGDANGSLTITASGGTPSYQYAVNSWPFGVTNSYSGLPAGPIALHIRDTNNCRVDSNIILSEPSPVAVALVVNNVWCNGDSTATVSVVASGGTPGYRYAINSGSFGSSSLFTGLWAGTHTVHVKDSNGCVHDTTFNISQPTKLRLAYSSVTPLCHGDLNGVITLTGIGGTLPYQYALDAGPFVSTNVFNGLGAGTHILHLKDVNGCTRDSLVALGEPTALGVSVVVTNVLCKGGATGTVTVSGSGGVPGYTYALDAGAYTASNLFTSLLAGNHTVHLKDANGCIKDTIVSITEPDSLKMALVLVHPNCNGASTGSITISGSGGTLPYTFSLNASPYTSTTFYGSLGFGAYGVHLKDGNGCKVDSNVNLVQPPLLDFNLDISNVRCFGDSTGQVTINAIGGTYPYFYTANTRPFDTIKVLTGFPKGIDTIHVKDINGCSKDTIINITEPSKLLLHYTLVSPLCHADSNGSIRLSGSGGTLPYTFALNSNPLDTTTFFNNIPAGSYGLHLVDSNGCRVDSNISLSEPQALSFTLNITNVLCHGDTTGTVSIVAAGGTPAYQYAKDGGSYGSVGTLTGFTVGSHTLHLKDANGCIKDTSIIITEPDSLKMTFTVTMPLCNGGTDGTATITGSGGTLPYTYAVDANVFQASPTLLGIAAGVHMLHITDRNGCTRDSLFTMNEPSPISISAAVKRARCTPLVNGYVWLYPTGGTPGYTYSYGGNPWQSSNQFNNLASGIYTFHVKDANGCVKDTIIAVFDSVFVHATYTQTNVSCFGGSDGTVTITPSGGDLPYTFAVNTSPYATTNPITGLPAAAHTLHVKDANGCILDTALYITQPQPLVPTVFLTQPLCNGGNNGSILVGISGGTPGYTFAIGGGGYSASNTFNNLKAGSYVLHIKDSKGCQKDTTVTLTEPTRIVIDSVIVTDVKCHGDNSGTATVFAHDGTPSYTYAADAAPYSGSNLITGLNVGAHVLHVRDANGCIRDTAVKLKEPQALSFTIPGINQPTCEGFKDGSISISARGGFAPYTYQMPPNPYKTVSLYTGLAEGSYTIRVKDSNNCTYDTTIVLSGYPHILIESAEVQDPSCHGFKDGVVKLNVTGGVAPLSYSGSGLGLTNNTGVFDTLRKGAYTFTVTDAKGCIKDTLLYLSEPPLLTIGSTATPNDCEGPDNGGKVTTITNGGTPPYTYLWSDQETTSDIVGVQNGAYWVTVTDAHNCKDSSLSVVGYDNCCLPFIPDAFTPNGDGKNDVFRVRWKGDISKMVFSIYNRYGTRVFVSYQPDFAWNGMYEGKLCDMGVYFYSVKFICGSKGDNEVSFKGDVTLIR
ncbi:MAG: gliding motility-associated C-terminal domain-containing protein [Bacteroidetes bacterium]|nr:gliding motility-associated C-terminal domain-containing protein [Bacteroidota bacterium]